MNCLIGKGTVGQNVLEQFNIDCVFDSKNFKDMIGNQFDIIFCAAPDARKWAVNTDPIKDLKNITELISVLETVKCNKFVLFSTVDAQKSGLEDSNLNFELCFYGMHRRLLEKYIARRFQSTIIRLPALFGPHLKKNLLYDIINNNLPSDIAPAPVFQWFNLKKIEEIVKFCFKYNVGVFHPTSEPISFYEIVEKFFPNKLHNFKEVFTFQHNLLSLYGEHNGYFFSKEETLKEISEYIESCNIKS